MSLTAPVFTLMIDLGDILGGNSVIFRLFGRKIDDSGKCLSAFCFYGTLILGVSVTVIMLLCRQPVL